MRLVAYALSVAFVTSAVVSAGIANADTGMQGSYIGVGAAAGLTNVARSNDAAFVRWPFKVVLQFLILLFLFTRLAVLQD